MRGRLVEALAHRVGVDPSAPHDEHVDAWLAHFDKLEELMVANQTDVKHAVGTSAWGDYANESAMLRRRLGSRTANRRRSAPQS